MMHHEIMIDGIVFKKSSLSRWGEKCVGVSIQNDAIFVVNTKTDGPIVRFTREEWQAFISGVKCGEFDLEEA